MFLSSQTTLRLGLLVALCGTGSVWAQNAPSGSPFMAAGGAGVSANAASGGNHELVGMIASSKQMLVGITDKSTRKSVWIPVGSTADGIEVVSCDPKLDTAVVRINGELQTLSMHGSALLGASQSPTPAPLLPPLTPPTGRTPAQLEQEKEARMLVSDLLEIGIQQRKAYETAQREAAGKKTGITPGTTPVQTPR